MGWSKTKNSIAMKREIGSYRVVILGDEYTVMSDESEEHVMQAANYVHALMQEITQKTPSAVPMNVAVLAALRLASKIICDEEVAKKHDEKSAEIARYVDRELLGLSSE